MQNEENKKQTKKSTKKDSEKAVTKKTSTTKKNTESKKSTKSTTKSTTKKATKPTVKKTKPKDVSEEKVVMQNVEVKEAKIDTSASKDKKELAFSLFEVILIIVITILSCLLIFSFIKSNEPKVPGNDVAEEYTEKDIELFLKQYNYILNNYYGDINKDELLKAAISGMLESLDDYSQIIDEESNSFSITLEGEYEGVGISIYNDIYGNIIIDSVYENTPAAKAGLKANDIVVKFNEMSLKNISTSELVNKIAANNEFKLTVLRDEKEIEVTLKREKVILNSVKYEMLDDKIGYIDIDIFANNTPEQFKNALTKLEKQKMKSLIIDLRDNTGGHLSSVEEMLYLFLDKKHVIYQLEDHKGTEKFYSKGTKTKTYDIVILQNGASASASEIMSSALKENLNAYIIGSRSFGKGTVQTLMDIDKDTQYKVTTKIWKTPKGNWINGTGIVPDLELPLSEQYYLEPTKENDNQLKAAIEHLK